MIESTIHLSPTQQVLILYGISRVNKAAPIVYELAHQVAVCRTIDTTDKAMVAALVEVLLGNDILTSLLTEHGGANSRVLTMRTNATLLVNQLQYLGVDCDHLPERVA